MTPSTTSIDIMGLHAAYASLHTDQERDYFMHRYHDFISSFEGKTFYNSAYRPFLTMRYKLFPSENFRVARAPPPPPQVSCRVPPPSNPSLPPFSSPAPASTCTHQ